MGVAFYIKLDPDEADLASSFDGKILAARAAELNAIAQACGLNELLSYLVLDDEMIEAFDIPDEVANEGPTGFKPEEGLHWFQTVREKIASDPKRLERAEELIEEIEAAEAVLKQAKETGGRWSLGMDF